MIHPCPVCCRPLRILENLCGCCVTCEHCRGSFVAPGPAGERQDSLLAQEGLLRRVDALLGLADTDATAHTDKEVFDVDFVAEIG